MSDVKSSRLSNGQSKNAFAAELRFLVGKDFEQRSKTQSTLNNVKGYGSK